jgi:hypothetical protein
MVKTNLIRPGKEMVEVHNLDETPYTEEYNEEVITIPPKSFILMRRRHAVKFLGKIPPDAPNGTLRVKMLQIRKMGSKAPGDTLMPEFNDPEFVCHLDGTVYRTQQELDNHLVALQHLTVKKKESVTCTFCDMSFSDMDVFLKHLEIHKENMSMQKTDKKEMETDKKGAKK